MIILDACLYWTLGPEKYFLNMTVQNYHMKLIQTVLIKVYSLFFIQETLPMDITWLCCNIVTEIAFVCVVCIVELHVL
jgi:hypothetical protein